MTDEQAAARRRENALVTGASAGIGAVKAWMISFSESLASELEEHGVTVTADSFRTICG